MFLLKSRPEPQNQRATNVIAFKPGLHGCVICNMYTSYYAMNMHNSIQALCRKMYNEAEIIVLQCGWPRQVPWPGLQAYIGWDTCPSSLAPLAYLSLKVILNSAWVQKSPRAFRMMKYFIVIFSTFAFLGLSALVLALRLQLHFLCSHFNAQISLSLFSSCSSQNLDHLFFMNTSYLSFFMNTSYLFFS